MYLPAFLEIFLGLAALLVWGRWLRDRTPLRWALRPVGLVCAVSVFVGQLAAGAGLLQATTGAPDAADTIWWARWASAGVVLAGLALHGVLTLHWLGRSRS